ncbi:putative oxidoreductase [Hyphodiscus hymeniophilus]|uniref:Oxidoreductase n=1 Tax=Hyphodiscus hymeniophilus TaxID=353542 RepID=A0A9P6VI37_9HELO|nr:putative oxidoreductase [Hyphodiscus hymeniophilus]
MPSYAVIGASRGLGFEWLRQLSSVAGNTVVGSVRDVRGTQEKLKAANITNVTLLSAEMKDYKSLNAMAAEAAKVLPNGLDYLIVNGAYQPQESFPLPPTAFIGKEDLLRDDMLESLEVNVLGPMYSINAFLPLLRKSSIKKIIVISTGMADPDPVVPSGAAFGVPYASIKAALNMVVAKYAAELQPEGITVLALSPGLVNTAEKAPTPEGMAMYGAMVQTFQTLYPKFQGPISPEESVTMQAKVIEKLGMAETGQFLSHYGNKQWL